MRRLAYLALLALTALTVTIVISPTKSPPPYSGPRILPPSDSPAGPSVLWVGDSFPAGTGAQNVPPYPDQVASRMHFVVNHDTQGGTGFIADGKENEPTFSPLPARIKADKASLLADIIVLDAGRNDGRQPAERLLPIVRSYLDEMAAAYPHARFVLIVPQYLTPTVTPIFEQVGDVYRNWAKDHPGTVVIDPMLDHWISSNSQARGLVIGDGVHPNDAGHTFYADHFVSGLQRARILTSG